MEGLTVDDFLNIVESQLCIYGDKKMFFITDLEKSEQPESFELFVGEDSVLECFNYDDSGYGCVEEIGLKSIENRLGNLDGSACISSSHNAQFSAGFQIGFKSSVDGFVETINSSELIKQTVVLEP